MATMAYLAILKDVLPVKSINFSQIVAMVSCKAMKLVIAIRYFQFDLAVLNAKL